MHLVGIKLATAHMIMVSWTTNTTYYSNLKTTYYLLYFFCLAHHLMCWSDTSDNNFKPVEKPSRSLQWWRKIFSESFQVWRKISLHLLLHVMCVAHSRNVVIDNSLVITCFRTYLFVYFSYAWWHHVYMDDCHKLLI